MDRYKKEFIEFMMRSKALAFGDFVTKSGRKTPFFINTGNYSTGAQLEKLGQYYADALINHMGNDGFDVLYGPAYKGIPLAAATAIALNVRHAKSVSYCFNRKEVKDHGEGGTVIGHKLREGDRVVIIEDVVSAGLSVRESIPVINGNTGAKAVGLIISVNRMERGAGAKSALTELRDEFGISAFSIVNLDEIVEYLHNREIDGAIALDDGIYAKIQEYRKRYGCT